jgi:nitronate monooxygenase
MLRFDPLEFTGGELPWLERPKFLAIVASVTLASMLAKKATGRVDGFVVEGPTAGGHNAPPRGQAPINERGEPIYGPRDVVDLDAIQALGLPFWLAGSYGSPEQVQFALDAGAAGVQVGTAFAYCDESGLLPEIKQRIRQMSRDGQVDVVTDPVASPTGFPFKVVQLQDTLSASDVYEKRQRICDMGFLRHAFRKEDGTIGWRCPSEPIKAFLHKGGELNETVGRKCLCNGLMANVGLEQVRGGREHELPLVTSGDEAKNLAQFFVSQEAASYSAADVVKYLLPKSCRDAVASRNGQSANPRNCGVLQPIAVS